MVVGAKISLQHVPSNGRMSIMKLHNLSTQKRQPVIKIVYGVMLVAAGLLMVLINPVQLVTDWIFDVKEGSFIYRVWERPPYQLYSEVWAFNYTNIPEYLNGDDTVLKLKEVGPFLYQEFRTNENVTLDKERGVMNITPRLHLQFLRNQSVADTKDIHIQVPNIALLAISTILADRLGYFANAGAYYSINALGSELFRNLTVEELLWGYEDPIVTIASSMLPGWIDFEKIGILDRFYAQREETAEVNIADGKSKFSILNWNNSPGIVEQGFKNLNTSTPCNLARGTYEGFMVSPNVLKNSTIPIFRRQACRIYPFSYNEERNDYGFDSYRFVMDEGAFNSTSPYACQCSENCIPDGFVDVSNCYYGFPIALSKPHFLDAAPDQQQHYEGMHPDKNIHGSTFDIEPTLGVPLSLFSKMQVNLAVRMSSGNPITRPFKDKMVPFLWLSLYCKEPPPEIVNLLRLRLVIAPPLIITVEVLLFITGFVIGISGFYRFWKPTYSIIEDKRKAIAENNNISDSIAFNDNEILSKPTLSLLSIAENDTV